MEGLHGLSSRLERVNLRRSLKRPRIPGVPIVTAALPEEPRTHIISQVAIWNVSAPNRQIYIKDIRRDRSLKGRYLRASIRGSLTVAAPLLGPASRHVFNVVKRLWGFAKNTVRLYTAFALANLYLLRRRLLPPQWTCA